MPKGPKNKSLKGKNPLRHAPYQSCSFNDSSYKSYTMDLRLLELLYRENLMTKVIYQQCLSIFYWCNAMLDNVMLDMKNNNNPTIAVAINGLDYELTMVEAIRYARFLMFQSINSRCMLVAEHDCIASKLRPCIMVIDMNVFIGKSDLIDICIKGGINKDFLENFTKLGQFLMLYEKIISYDEIADGSDTTRMHATLQECYDLLQTHIKYDMFNDANKNSHRYEIEQMISSLSGENYLEKLIYYLKMQNNLQLMESTLDDLTHSPKATQNLHSHGVINLTPITTSA